MSVAISSLSLSLSLASPSLPRFHLPAKASLVRSHSLPSWTHLPAVAVNRFGPCLPVCVCVDLALSVVSIHAPKTSWCGDTIQFICVPLPSHCVSSAPGLRQSNLCEFTLMRQDHKAFLPPSLFRCSSLHPTHSTFVGSRWLIFPLGLGVVLFFPGVFQPNQPANFLKYCLRRAWE